jgi:MoaA/NifB/PqqE/SkfB family radical SAM enzyme
MEDATFAALEPLIRRTKRVHLQGWGEPLLHPRFFEYAEAAVRAGSAVSTTTYGLAVNKANAARLTASGIDVAAFSLTGVDGASNTARAGVPFEGARDGILALNRAKRQAGREYPRVHLAYLMLASQAESVARLPDLMHSLNVPVAVVSTLDYIAAPGMEAEAYAPHETEKIEHARALLSGAAERAAALGRTIHYSLPGEHGRNDCNERIQTCMYIDAEGVIAPCIYVNLPTDEDDPCRRAFGSVRERNPLDIWNDPEYARFRKRLASGDPDLPCVACAKRFERIF